MVDDIGSTQFVQEPCVATRENDIIQSLKAIVQEPLPHPFKKSNGMWLPHVTHANCMYKQCEIALIPWDCLMTL